jgi:hypothetical protein
LSTIGTLFEEQARAAVQIEIVIVNDRNSAEFEEPAGAAVGEAFKAHDGSKEADFWEPASESESKSQFSVIE